MSSREDALDQDTTSQYVGKYTKSEMRQIQKASLEQVIEEASDDEHENDKDTHPHLSRHSAHAGASAATSEVTEESWPATGFVTGAGGGSDVMYPGKADEKRIQDCMKYEIAGRLVQESDGCKDGCCWAFNQPQSVNMFMPSGHEKPVEESVEYEGEGELICNMAGDTWVSLPYIIIDSGAAASVLPENGAPMSTPCPHKHPAAVNTIPLPMEDKYLIGERKR